MKMNLVFIEENVNYFWAMPRALSVASTVIVYCCGNTKDPDAVIVPAELIENREMPPSLTSVIEYET